MLNENRLYRLFPKPRFYLIALGIAALFVGYECLIMERTPGGVPAIAATAFVIIAYITAINASSALTFAVIPGEGMKYFRSVPGAYRRFRRTLYQCDLLGLAVTAASCLFVGLGDFGTRRVLALLLMSLIVLNTMRFAIRAKTRVQYTLTISGGGGMVGGFGAFLFGGDGVTETGLLIPIAVLGAVWLVATILLYKDLDKLWARAYSERSGERK
ncbi:MAG: hypothetical protein NC084_01385 [Bacteroides sp.]|nr:hypothetical protein [Eubacterium sp.]MCM1417764.1 hypothetical protein [Roseburia sp.]MCM1461345.1 hypothetical protein [Bacteroides sp.]